MNRATVETMAGAAAIIGAAQKANGPGHIAALVWQLHRISRREGARLVAECNTGPLQKGSTVQREKDRARVAEIAASTGVAMKLLDDADPRGAGFVAIKAPNGHRGNSIDQDGWWRL